MYIIVRNTPQVTIIVGILQQVQPYTEEFRRLVALTSRRGGKFNKAPGRKSHHEHMIDISKDAPIKKWPCL